MKYFGILTLFLFAMSCSPTYRYFTKETNDSHKWTTENLSQIQFYISDDIILYRDASTGESYVEGGKIKMIEGRKVEEIIIKRGTKGQYLFSPRADQYAISFDANDDTKYLVFGASPKVDQRYVLLAKEWQKSSWYRHIWRTNL
jgi:hypothetical protein